MLDRSLLLRGLSQKEENDTNATMSNNLNDFTPEPNDSGDVTPEPKDPGSYEVAIVVISLIFLMFCCLVATAALMKGEADLTRRRQRAAASSSRREFLAKRKELIATQLIVREWNADDTTVNTADDATANTDPDPTIPTSEQVDNDEPLWDENGCAICFSPFEDHDLVCESNNLSCKHVFHKDCLVQWLERHEDCPICRNIYILETV